MRHPDSSAHDDGEAGGHIEIDAGDTLWRFERRFLTSNWTCIWGRGCQGILPEPATHLHHGCCSFGAELDGLDEARTVAAFADTLPPELFQHRAAALAGGIFSDETCTNTRVVDGACIFLNRADHPGGAGCALHLGALAAGESPVDWKPSVCWQLPVKVDWEMRDDDIEVATVRGWQRRDWGADGEVMAWCCTEGPEAYVGDRPVVESLGEELAAMVGDEVYVELRRRLDAESSEPGAEVAEVPASAAELQDRLEQTTAALEAARTALGLALGTLHETRARAGQSSAESAELERLGAALDEIRASEAFRVGLAVTWPARHLKRLLRRS
jgi:hypothetical protein